MSAALPSAIQLEAELLRRGIDPDLAVLAKQEYPGDLPEFVTRTEFLALTMRMGYQRAVAIVQARLELRELEQALRAHRADGPLAPVMQAARVTEVAQQFQPTAQQTTRAAYLRGASQGVPALTRAGIQIRFDVMNPHAAQYAASSSSELITHINDSQRDAVRALIEGAVGTGRTVQETALDIRNVVGLRPDQVNALSKFRERLAGRDLTIDQVEKKVARYANALLKQRGELIARTEILTAANRGQLELWREARRDGKLDATWLKQWILTPDELLCEFCEPMDDTPVGLNDNFDSELGPVQHPPLHPQCRCTLGLVKVEPNSQRASIVAFVKFNEEQPRDPAGTSTGGQWTSTGNTPLSEAGQAMMADAPLTGKGRAAWQRKAASVYASDPEFKLMADAVAYYTQGEYDEIRKATMEARGMEVQAYQEGERRFTDEPLNALAHPMADYKNFIPGQNIVENSEVTVGQAALTVHEAVKFGPAIGHDIHRGVILPKYTNTGNKELGEWLANAQPGSTLSFEAPTSFTGDVDIANQFATGMSTGQRRSGANNPGIVFHVEQARGLKVSALSPWKNQAEVLSSGKYVVVRVEGDRPEKQTSTHYNFDTSTEEQVSYYAFPGRHSENQRVAMDVYLRQA